MPPPALSQGTAQPVGSLGHKLPTFWSLCGRRLCPFSSVIPTDAQTRDPQQAALDDFVAARMLNTKCPTWQIDLAEARTRFAQLNLQLADWQEDGHHSKFFDERLSYYGSLLSRMSEMRACAAAEQAFGPDGRVRKDWMKQR